LSVVTCTGVTFVESMARSKKRLRHLGVASLGEVGIDDLAILIDGAVDVGPLPSQSGVGLINPPFLAERMVMNTSRVLEQGQEALDQR